MYNVQCQYCQCCLSNVILRMWMCRMSPTKSTIEIDGSSTIRLACWRELIMSSSSSSSSFCNMRSSSGYLAVMSCADGHEATCTVHEAMSCHEARRRSSSFPVTPVNTVLLYLYLYNVLGCCTCNVPCRRPPVLKSTSCTVSGHRHVRHGVPRSTMSAQHLSTADRRLAVLAEKWRYLYPDLYPIVIMRSIVPLFDMVPSSTVPVPVQQVMFDSKPVWCTSKVYWQVKMRKRKRHQAKVMMMCWMEDQQDEQQQHGGPSTCSTAQHQHQHPSTADLDRKMRRWCPISHDHSWSIPYTIPSWSIVSAIACSSSSSQLPIVHIPSPVIVRCCTICCTLLLYVVVVRCCKRWKAIYIQDLPTLKALKTLYVVQKRYKNALKICWFEKICKNLQKDEKKMSKMSKKMSKNLLKNEQKRYI